MEIEINTDVFAAVALFKAVKDIRYYLNAVLIETGPEGARLVATDGPTMAVAKIDGVFPAAAVILPDTLVDAVKYAKRGPDFVTFIFEPGVGFASRKVSLVSGAQTSVCEEIDGKYPDFRRAMPQSVSGDTAQYDPEYLMRLAKAAKILGVPYGGIAYNGPSAGICVLREDVVAVVMPTRLTPETSTPCWTVTSLNPSPDTAPAA